MKQTISPQKLRLNSVRNNEIRLNNHNIAQNQLKYRNSSTNSINSNRPSLSIEAISSNLNKFKSNSISPVKHPKRPSNQKVIIHPEGTGGNTIITRVYTQRNYNQINNDKTYKQNKINRNYHQPQQTQMSPLYQNQKHQNSYPNKMNRNYRIYRPKQEKIITIQKQTQQTQNHLPRIYQRYAQTQQFPHINIQDTSFQSISRNGNINIFTIIMMIKIIIINRFNRRKHTKYKTQRKHSV